MVAIYKEELQQHKDFSIASSSLTTALLDRIGGVNRTHLKTNFPQLKSYMLTPRHVIDAILTKHGVATSDDVAKLRAPLSLVLTSLSDLTTHMENFLLASQRLTRVAKMKRFPLLRALPFSKRCRASPQLHYGGVLHQVSCYTTAELGHFVSSPGIHTRPFGPRGPGLTFFWRRQKRPCPC